MKRVAVLLAFFALLSAACSDNSKKNEATTTTTTAIEIVQTVRASVDWQARTVSISDSRGYTIEFCDGAGPLLCVRKPGEEVLGVIELISRTDGADLTRVGAPDWAEDFIASIAADRAKGCDPAYKLTPDRTVGADVAGRPGFRYSFTGAINGRTVERVVGFGTVISGDLHILVLNALADNGCLNRESELPLTDAKRLEPVVAALASGSTNLPNP